MCAVGRYLMEVTSQPRETAALHILDPMKPFPPQTMIRLAEDMVGGAGW